MAFWLRYKKKLTTVKYQITCKVQPKSSDQNNSNSKKNHSMHKGYSRLLEHFFTLFPRPELKLDLRAVNFFFLACFSTTQQYYATKSVSFLSNAVRILRVVRFYCSSAVTARWWRRRGALRRRPTTRHQYKASMIWFVIF